MISPPFSFPGITARVFPLRANMDILSAFYRSYLDVAPEICQHRPYLPCVFLVVLDYGRMAIETANLGWVAQHEVFFAVPLEQWVRDRPGDPMTFRGWVVNTPFIFVDNASSLTTGREVYGWPKILAAMQPSVEQWLADPRYPTRLLSLSVEGFGSRDCEPVRLLDIDQELAQNPSLVPPGLSAIDPFGRLSRLNRTSWRAAWDLAQILVRSPLSGFGPPEPGGDRSEILFESLRQMAGLFRQPGVGVVTLKQFREAGDPTLVCYQSLVQSRLGVSRYDSGGALGLYNLLQGDITGGYRIRLYDSPSFQIVESLGLEVAWEEAGGGATRVLEPFFPSWMKVDLTYGRGRSICWRTRGEPWYRKRVPFGGRSLQAPAPYNTTAGAAQQVWPGPFLIPHAYCEVFPLAAHPEVLRAFIHRYLHQGPDSPYSFEPWGSYVYMLVYTGTMFSQERTDRSIAANEISFSVPVRWLEGGRLKSFVLVKPFAFIDNPTLTMTAREVQGVPARDATITPYLQFWRSKGPVLGMQTDVFPALDTGLRSERRTLLEVLRAGSRAAPPDAEPGLAAAPLFHPPLTVQMLMLKQFRDAGEPRDACYKSLVLEPWKLSDLQHHKLLGHETTIRVYRYPSLPLVETLGLEVHSTKTSPPDSMDGMIADVLIPHHPFRIEMSVEIELAETISRTAGFLPWRPPPKLPRKRKGLAPEEAAPAVHEALECGPQPLIEAFLRGGPGESSP